MWFNNALLFHYELNDPTDFNQALSEEALKPCPPHARFIYGWLPAYSDELVQEVAGCAHVCLGKEERILPTTVIKRFVNERVAALELEQGRNVKRAERAQMAEDIEFELLPKSFCVQKRLNAMFDTQAKRLIINTASATQATQLTGLLRKSIPGIHIEPVSTEINLALRFSEWIKNPQSLPPNFQLGSDCRLICLDDEKKNVSCKGYELPADEVLTLLEQGLAPSELSLIWNERIQFTLTHELIFKRLKCLDYLIDEFTELNQLEEDYLQQDAALTLLCGELRQMTDDLLNALQPQNTPSHEKEHPAMV